MMGRQILGEKGSKCVVQFYKYHHAPLQSLVTFG